MDFWGGPSQAGYNQKAWKKAKKKSPGLSFWGDADLDGTPNGLDSHPFNPSKNGFMQYLKKAQKGLAKKHQRLSKKRFAKTTPLMSAYALATGTQTQRVGKGVGGKGRPKRPSGRYRIPGRGPVYVGEYKRWLAANRAKRMMMAKKLPESEAYETNPDVYLAQEELSDVGSPQGRLGYVQPEHEGQVAQTVGPDGQFSQEAGLGLSTGPTYYGPEEEEYQEEQHLQPVQQEGRTALESENPHHAPNVFKGELAGTVHLQVGGPTREGTILNAPDVGRGELRLPSSQGSPAANVMQTGMDYIKKPITNPEGDVYVDIDPASGRPILRKRSRERWLSGD